MSAAATGAATLGTETDGRSSVIRWVRVDALMSGVAGVGVAAGAPLLDDVLGAPAAFLVPLGLFLLAYAAALLALARSGAPSGGVKVVIAGNAAWVVLSVVAVLADWLTLTTTGTIFALAQACAVAAIAELQLLALRRAA